MVAKKAQSTPKPESFEETAKRVGADDDEEAFRRKLEKIAKAKPKDAKKD